ncbi:phage minor head protein [Elstera cyanobacteriorum]|uniref:phage minor head protein n=1 Tax=Elstera cyanobacteriorum TaxID=2022747 RepID=UPI002354CF38|nr:phage minor head protein [Elstera cyanobacteriorum]MCK6442286.1 hypothetical protein [Elstera cyanobacteriorum]
MAGDIILGGDTPDEAFARYLRLAVPREDALAAVLEDELNATWQAAARAVENGGVLPAVGAGHRSRLTKILKEHFSATAEAFARDILIGAPPALPRSTKALMRDLVLKRAGEHGPWQEAVQEFVSREALAHLNETSAETMSAIRRRISEGLAAGKPNSEIAKRIRDDSPGYNRARAETIAITETHNAGVGATYTAVDSLGYQTEKTWCAVGDRRTRPTHAAASGQTVAMDGFFSVGGAKMPRPGVGPAKETVRCRCCLTYRISEAAQAEGRRFEATGSGPGGLGGGAVPPAPPAPPGGGSGSGSGPRWTRGDFDRLAGRLDLAEGDDAVRAWNLWIDRNPAEVYRALAQGLPGLARFGVDLRPNGSGALRMVLTDAAGAQMAEADRTFDFARRIAYNAGLIVEAPWQGQNIGRTHLASLLLDFYLPAGVERVAVTAGLDVGGYTWARAGFIPTPESWKSLQAELMRRYEGWRLNDPILLATILDDDPRSIWGVADHKQGKRLLLGTGWKGSIDLTDAEMLERLRLYGRRP